MRWPPFRRKEICCKNPTTRPENRFSRPEQGSSFSGLHRPLFSLSCTPPLCSAFIYFVAGTDPPLAARDPNLLDLGALCASPASPQQNHCPQEQQLDAARRSRCQHVSPSSRGPDRSGPAAGGSAIIRQQYSITGRGASHEQLASHQTGDSPNGSSGAAPRRQRCNGKIYAPQYHTRERSIY